MGRTTGQPQLSFPSSNLEDGQFLCALKPGDRLGVDALHEFASATSSLEGGVEFVYADERRLEGGGGRPFLKPDWSPDLIWSMNYVGPTLGRLRGPGAPRRCHGFDAGA